MDTSSSNLRLEVGQFSHPGRKRTNNEDWLGAFQPDDAQRLAVKGRLFLVADGMGGHRSGELASRQAVDHVIRAYFDDPEADVAASLQRAFQSANSSLYAGQGLSSDAGRGSRSGTTLVAAVIQDRGGGGARLWIANVGDSRAYLLRGRTLRQLSRDHSLAAAGLAGEGLGRHVVTRALGVRPEVKVDVFTFSLGPGDEILLCTDGLTGPVPDAEIVTIVQRRAPQDAARRLVEAANESGGPDNVSAILIRLAGEPSTWRAAWDAILARLWPGSPQTDGVQRSSSLLTPALVILVLLAILILLGLGFALGRALF